MEKKRVLMICLGNICRSPIAEALFAKIIKEKELQDNWDVESAALVGYHTGKSPDHRAMETLKKNGITDYSHKARPIEKADFDKFDWIFGMDEDNIAALLKKKPQKCRATVELLGHFDKEGPTIIRDPYYDNDSKGFQKAYEECERSILGFFEKVERE